MVSSLLVVVNQNEGRSDCALRLFPPSVTGFIFKLRGVKYMCMPIGSLHLF